MADIPLSGSEGLFTRIGALGGLASAMNAGRGTEVPDHVDYIHSLYENTDQNIIDTIYGYLASYQSAISSYTSFVPRTATTTLIQMANDSSTQHNAGLRPAMNLLIAQMQAAGQTVQACAVGATATPMASNLGNATIAISMLDVYGRPLEYAFAETATAVVTSDSQRDITLQGVEPITLVTLPSVSDTFSWMYPAGSGVALNFSAVSPLRGNKTGTQNWLVNGGMEAYTATANVPDSWHLAVGVPGTTVRQATGGFAYDGLSALAFVGNGSELTALYQVLSAPGVVGDTAASVLPYLQLFACFALRMSAAPPSGQLTVSLSAGGAVIADDSGQLNRIVIDLATLTAAYQVYQVAFRTPRGLPAAPCQLRFALTAPLPAGFTLYLDHAALCQPSILYPGGPAVAVFAGPAPLVAGDSFAILVANDYGGKLQCLFDRCFNMKSLGLVLPSAPAGSNTIPDSLYR